MATKELAFASRIKSLKECVRQITCFTQAPPTGSDVANTIKYFTTTLLNILKDAPSNIEGERFYGAKYAKSSVRLTMFPTLNYSGLFEVLCSLIPVVHLVTLNQDVLMEHVIQLIACITPFLTWDQLTELPFKVALMLPMANASKYEDIIHLLCVNLLPNTLGRNVGDNVMTTEAIGGILMLILQHCNDPRIHSMVIESLLPLRDHLYKDLFMIISYGPPNTRMPATVLLFHYWPQLRNLLPTTSVATDSDYTVVPWQVPRCQRVQCINKVARPAASKMCTHPSMCAAECQLPPPAFICVDCYDTHGMRSYDDWFVDVVLPSEHISTICANKACLAPGSKAMAVCTSLSCVKMNRFRPVSLCSTCHTSRHPGECAHVQLSINNIWMLEPETQSYIVDAIVNLLREAEPQTSSSAETALQPIMDNTAMDFMATKNPKNSKYGILLLKELCQPRHGLSVEALGRLVGMLFHWFKCTGSTPDPQQTETMEQLKVEFMTTWLQEVKKTHYEVILSTLLPHPPDFAKVGGQWERLSSRSDQLKEGLEILIMLGPYDVITYEIWDYILPYWLESIRTELTLKERDEIKIPLRQNFDVEMSPLPFLIDKMFHFISERLETPDDQIQEQGLQWLQILTSVEIIVPYVFILKMYEEARNTLLKCADPLVECGGRTNIEVKLNCFIIMLDIILAQCKITNVLRHGGVTQKKTQDMFRLVNDMIICIRHIPHSDDCGKGSEDCNTCRRLSVFYQLAFTALESVCPRLESSLPVLDIKQLAAKINQPAPDATCSRENTNTEMPEIHNLFVNLVQVLETDKDLDICYYIVNSLKVLFVHGQCLNDVCRTHPACIEDFLQQQFVPRLWSMLNSRHSRTARVAVTMLFHSIALGNGHKYFWSIVDADCTHRNWQIRYAAVDKIRMIWEFSNANFLSKNQIVMTSLAHVFCQYVTLLHDPDHNVAQRALLQLKLLGEVALQAVIRCMSVQFDVVVKDRQLILNKLSQLQNTMPDREVFSWAFFLARLQQLYVEAELSETSSESSNRGSMVKVGTDQNLDQMMKIAQFAAMRCDSISSIRDHSGVYDKSSVSLAGAVSNISKDRKFAGGQFLKHKGKKKTTSHSDNSLQDWLMLAHESLQDLSYLQHMLARSRKDEVMPEIGSENAKIIKTLWKAMENDRLDHSVLHLLVSTIVKYMSLPSTNEFSQDEHHSTKQSSTIEHIFYVLGYADSRFFVQPTQLRASAVLDALLTNLPKFLDGNVELGTKVLPDCLNVLRFCGSPQKYASDNQSADYTLIHLPQSLTKYWVQSLLIVLYKYNYSNNSELSPSVNYLVRIILNTLSAIPHSCKKSEGDKDSIAEVQGLFQGLNEQEPTTHKLDHEEGVSPASSSSEIVRQKSSVALPSAALLIGASAIIHEEDELEPLSISRRPTMDRSDFASKQSLNSKVTGSEGRVLRSRSSQSPASLKKSLTQDALKSGKKGKRLQRQTGVDQPSPSKSPHKLKHSKTVESSKSDDFAASLENPQKSSTPPKGRTSTDKHVQSSDSVSAADIVLDLKKPESSNKFGAMLSKMGKKQNSKQNVLDYAVSVEDEQSAKIQSAADATDYMARSKRGHAYNVGKQDSTESGDHAKHCLGHLSPTSNIRITCPECQVPLESYTEEIIVLCIVAVETYLNHDLNQAASMVYEMILSISKIANTQIYSWQNLERPVFIPGNVTNSALQFLRCTLHHLHPYNLMSALLLSSEDTQMFKVIVTALSDFPELSSQQALLTALEGINERSEITKVMKLVGNLNSYLSAITTDLSATQEWPKIVDQLEIFFRKMLSHIPEEPTDISGLLTLMSTILKLPIVTTHKGDRLVETYGKLLSAALQTHTFNMIQLAKLCQLCYRTFSRERDKTILARMIVSELIQVLKYKSTLPEANVLMLLEIVCMDCGSTLLPTYITSEIPAQLTCDMIIETGIIDVMRLYLNDAIEFVSDLHTLLKLKDHMKSTCLHEDTFGGLLKTGIAQIIALEMSTLLQNDVKATQRVIPWLYNQPNTVQRGPKEFLESVDHVRFLCWLYIGALTHHAVAENVLRTKCQPLPLDDVDNISVMVMSIMTGFVEYAASSVEFMSSLFYGFILCQVWTIYCETLTLDGIERLPEEPLEIATIIYDFWAKVTPTILNLMSSSRVLTEMVNLHVLSLMETLQECQSSVVVKLFPIWRQLLYCHDKLPVNILVRLQTLENWQPSSKKKYNKAILFDWIKKVQFKLAQIEVQSSTAVKFLSI